MTTLYVVRHAEAEGNIYRRVHGTYDGYITKNGEAQIERLKKRFETVSVDAVYTSDLSRTRQTATAIYEGKDIPVYFCPELREFHFGIWEDLTWGELVQDFPEQYHNWSFDPMNFRVEGSETYHSMYCRVKAKLDEIVAEHPNGTVAVVTHGTVIRALLCAFLYDEDFSRILEVQWCDNTAVACLEHENGKYAVTYCNDNEHLQEVSTLDRQQWWREVDDPAYFNLHFRLAEFPKDLELLDGYYHAAWLKIFGRDDYDSAQTKARMKRLLAADPRAIAVAQRREEDVGAILLDTRAKVLPDAGHIALLYLTEENRGKYMGAILIGYAASLYRSMGKKYLSVRVAQTNTPARKFYEKMGFEEMHMEQDNGIIQIILRKQILDKF
ncbi:MAG: GNAT family N-acetyltransferase [Oscillospiraceae bacterium]|nr:GNAT family N-acetyltransferase [Oscillospiraceae bacterium]